MVRIGPNTQGGYRVLAGLGAWKDEVGHLLQHQLVVVLANENKELVYQDDPHPFYFHETLNGPRQGSQHQGVAVQDVGRQIEPALHTSCP